MKALLLCAFLMICYQASAHSIHRSTSEAEYNQLTHQLEVSLTVFINDLELALIRQSEKMITFEKTPDAELDQEIQFYLIKNFVLMDSKHGSCKLSWVGRKMETDSLQSDEPEVTLFFQIALPDGLSAVTLCHAVFHDLYQDQINLLHLRGKAKQTELRFTRKDAKKRLMNSE